MKKYPKAKLHNGLIKYECRNGVGIHNVQVIECLDKLNRVPLNLQEIIGKEELEVIFFNGPLTANPEIKRTEYILNYYDEDTNWSKIYGIYYPYSRKIFIGIKGNYYPRHFSIKGTFLHELGHGFDHIIGEYFYHKQISKLKKVRNAIEEEPFYDEYYHIPKEYVANSVKLFYYDSHSKGILRKKHPTIFGILDDINNECK
jgi:hypothetical protein